MFVPIQQNPVLSYRNKHRIDVCSYTIGQDSVVPVIKERMNTYQETRPLRVLNGGKEIIQWSLSSQL